MKKNTTPELSAKWWSAHQPEGLASAKDLEKALGDYEAAFAKRKKDGPENNLSACLKALTQTESAAKKLQGEAEKLIKSPPKKSKSTPEDYQNTVEALKKYPKIVDAARKEVEGSAKTAAQDPQAPALRQGDVDGRGGRSRGCRGPRGYRGGGRRDRRGSSATRMTCSSAI